MIPRYLTPLRLTLLVLAQLYIIQTSATNEENSDRSKSAGSDNQLGILSFIATQITSTAEHHDQNDPRDMDDDALNPDVTGRGRNGPRIAGGDITSLKKRLSHLQHVRSGRGVYDELLHMLWNLLTGPDSLFDMFELLKSLTTVPAVLVQKEDNGEDVRVPKIARCSPLGQFIRRCCYEFERLQFADVQKLWIAFERYRMPSSEAVHSRGFKTGPSTRSDGTEVSSDHTTSGAEFVDLEFVSVRDIETTLSKSIQHLQKSGSRVPPELKLSLRRWIEGGQQNSSGSGVQPLQFFMAFFEHWRAAQMEMALENLRRYFDYSVAAKPEGEHVKGWLQYAHLHQSVLYADFQCWEESVNAMNECIATARENQDTACLNFALSWLLHLRQVVPDRTGSDGSSSFRGLIKSLGGSGSDEDDEIAFLKTKARASHHWSLLSTTLLEEAKLEMGRGSNITKYSENVLQAACLNVQHDLKGLMTATSLFESAGFERLGQSRLGYRICEGATVALTSQAPLSDHVRAVCRLAHVHTQMGRYATARAMLDELHPHVKGVIKLEHRVSAFKGLMELKQLIHRGRRHGTSQLLAELHAVCIPAGPEVEFELYLLNVQHLLETEDYEQAMSLVNTRLVRIDNNRVYDIAQRFHLLLLKCKIFSLAAQPEKGFSIALRVATMSHRSQLVPTLVMAVSVLSKTLADLGEFEAAKNLCEAGLPHALLMPDLQLRAELFSCLADAHVGLSLNYERSAPESTMNMNLAVAYNDRCLQTYACLEHHSGTSQCLIKKIKAARWNNDFVTESSAGDMHRQVQETGDPSLAVRSFEGQVSRLRI